MPKDIATPTPADYARSTPPGDLDELGTRTKLLTTFDEQSFVDGELRENGIWKRYLGLLLGRVAAEKKAELELNHIRSSRGSETDRLGKTVRAASSRIATNEQYRRPIKEGFRQAGFVTIGAALLVEFGLALVAYVALTKPLRSLNGFLHDLAQPAPIASALGFAVVSGVAVALGSRALGELLERHHINTRIKRSNTATETDA